MVLAGCTCIDCAPSLYDEYGNMVDNPYVPQPYMPDAKPFTDFIDPNKVESMSKDAFNLARISRGEEGKTAYFYYPDIKDAPETITWLWSDGAFSQHVKQSVSPSTTETQKEWWEKHVVNAPWPSTELIVDLYEDVFVPKVTKTYRYQNMGVLPIITKTEATKLLKDPLFVSDLAKMAGDQEKVKAFIKLKAKQPPKKIPKPKPSPAKKTPKPKPSPAKKTPNPKAKTDDQDLSDIEPENPFEEVTGAAAKGHSIKIVPLDENGKWIGTPSNLTGVASFTLYDDSSEHYVLMKKQQAFYSLLNPKNVIQSGNY